MKKKLCLIHANCQGEPLEELLNLNPDFSDHYETRHFTNYLREPIPDRLIEGCDLFLYQYVGKDWGKLGSDHLCSKLKPRSVSLAIPSMFFKNYWPLWTNTPGFDYPDIFLESLLERELTESQILHLYLNSRLDRIYDFTTLTSGSEKHELAKENRTPIKYVDYIKENYRERRLFNTVNHPGKELMIRTADKILNQLGMAPLTDKAIREYPETFPEIELPIHPQVAEKLDLNFGGPEEKYYVYGAIITFEEYIIRYIKCRKSGISDFIGFLHATASL